jgi:Tfp pilus assembly protein PilN
MINLLPPSTKEGILYARRNSQLRRYCLLIVLVMLGIAVIAVAGGWHISRTQASYEQQLAQSKSVIENRKLGSVQEEAETIAENIKLTINVLSKEVLFSKLLKQIGSVMPANTSLNDLKIDTDESAITLSALAQDYSTATQIQVNLSDPANKIFKSADIISINCDNTDQRYPCTVSLRALFGDNKSYLFVDTGKDT